MVEKDGEEGFLGRWSRLKRTAREAEPELPEPEPVELAERTPPAPVPQAAPDRQADQAPPPDLPPVESLDAGSDYTAFLRREVPADLRRLALRKAWTSDPAIAAFRGFGEYDWDCNAPGYGALRPTDDIKSLLAAIFPDPEPEQEPDEASSDRPPLPPREREGTHAEHGKGEGGSEHESGTTADSPSPSPPLRGGSPPSPGTGEGEVS